MTSVAKYNDLVAQVAKSQAPSNDISTHNFQAGSTRGKEPGRSAGAVYLLGLADAKGLLLHFVTPLGGRIGLGIAG